jgi:hypothetical protein
MFASSNREWLGKDESMTSTTPGTQPALKEIVTDAIRYWEPRRLVYNLILVAVTFHHFREAWSKGASLRPSLLDVSVLIGLALAANLAYCTAYLPDVFAQHSEFRRGWRRFGRPALLTFGTAFAGLLAHLISSGVG